MENIKAPIQRHHCRCLAALLWLGTGWECSGDGFGGRKGEFKPLSTCSSRSARLLLSHHPPTAQILALEPHEMLWGDLTRPELILQDRGVNIPICCRASACTNHQGIHIFPLQPLGCDWDQLQLWMSHSPSSGSSRAPRTSFRQLLVSRNYRHKTDQTL